MFHFIGSGVNLQPAERNHGRFITIVAFHSSPFRVLLSNFSFSHPSTSEQIYISNKNLGEQEVYYHPRKTKQGLNPATKTFLIIVVVFGAIAGTAIGIFANQRSTQFAEYDKLCNDTRAKVVEIAKDPSIPIGQKRTMLDNLISDTNRKLPQYQYQCDITVPALVGEP